MKKTTRVAALLFAALAAQQVVAEVKPAGWIASGMVLQRETPAVLAGTANDGETVEVVFQKKTYTTKAASGEWRIELPAQKAGGPHTITIAGKEYTDVLFGDVFLCSGQSNMELTVQRVMDMFADEILSYENENIRFFTIPHIFDFTGPQNELPKIEWKRAVQKDVMPLSCFGYFFAKQMYEATGVPVGLLLTSWGGTPIDAWMSEEAVRAFPLSYSAKQMYNNPEYIRHLQKVEGESYKVWSQLVYSLDPGKQAATQWSADEFDASEWGLVDMFGAWEDTQPLSPEAKASVGRSRAGTYWLRKDFEVAASEAGKAATLRMGCIIDADSIWVNGKFVGSISYQYPPRIYNIPEGLLREGKNNITVRVLSNGGRPSFVKEKPYKILLPEGKEISLEGQWRYRRGAVVTSAPASTSFWYKPVCLYNAMLYPLRHARVKSAVWYQGESNVGNEGEYALMLSAMMKDWRQTFNTPDMQFYVVELADHLAADDWGKPAWIRFQDMQRSVAATEANCDLVPNRDLGEWNDIHPLDKKTLTKRLVDLILEKK